ncbi:MAG: hypothetical protein M3497_02080 [Gemmatimonadota bacterium]|nr:hypothetical protein [Gemmatimonadota bacterium]
MSYPYPQENPLGEVVQRIRDSGLRPQVNYDFPHNVWTLVVDGRLVAAALKMEELAAAGYEWLTQLHANKMNSATGVAAAR